MTNVSDHSTLSCLSDRYEIVQPLGKGGMASVYEGRHRAIGKRVAVKVLHPRFSQDERYRARFVLEARAASMIEHPNVVNVTDLGHTDDGSLFLAMEFLQGRDLACLIERHIRLPWKRAQRILLQCARALAAVHSSRLLHRDIKPSNFFMLTPGPDGEIDRIKLIDFGIAKMLDSSEGYKPLTAADEIVGTATYMAPELFYGHPPSIATDIYSFGVLAYEMITGQRPFRGSSMAHIARQHITSTPLPPGQIVAGTPHIADTIVMRCLAKNPQHRFSSMDDIVGALFSPVSSPTVHLGATALSPPQRDPKSEQATQRRSRHSSRPANDCYPETEAHLGCSPSEEKPPTVLRSSTQPCDLPRSPSALLSNKKDSCSNVKNLPNHSISISTKKIPRALAITKIALVLSMPLIVVSIATQVTTANATSPSHDTKSTHISHTHNTQDYASQLPTDGGAPNSMSAVNGGARTGGNSNAKIGDPNAESVNSKTGMQDKSAFPLENGKDNRAGNNKNVQSEAQETEESNEKKLPTKNPCSETRAKAFTAKNRSRWNDVLKHTKKRICWHGTKLRLDRDHLRILAYSERGDYRKCAQLGDGSQSPAVRSRAAQCRREIDIPYQPSPSLIRSAILRKKNLADRCQKHLKPEDDVKIRVKLWFSGLSGAVVEAKALDGFADTPVGKCVVNALAKTQVPQFSKPKLGVIYSVSL